MLNKIIFIMYKNGFLVYKFLFHQSVVLDFHANIISHETHLRAIIRSGYLLSAGMICSPCGCIASNNNIYIDRPKPPESRRVSDIFITEFAYVTLTQASFVSIKPIR